MSRASKLSGIWMKCIWMQPAIRQSPRSSQTRSSLTAYSAKVHMLRKLAHSTGVRGTTHHLHGALAIRPRPSEGQFLGKKAVSISSHGAMRRKGARFALISVGERGHQTLLLRLSPVLRNAMVMY